jgi:tetraacyldisaccharide 4'-kinase
VSVREYWEAVVRGDSRGAAASVFAVALRLASLLQWLALHANLAVYRVGLRQRQRLDCPVLVVGNLTLGGTGKTTTTAYLVRRLAERGVRAGVVLRGYGRKIGNVPLLVGDGERILASPEEGGDEAVMLASMLPGHPVAVGLRREQVSRLLRRETGVDVVVLDDGFQYFRLHRDADIVLVDASRPIESDALFPAGTLREPHHHLRRATQVWLTHAELVEPERIHSLREWITAQAPDVPVVVAEHQPRGMRSLGSCPPPGPGAKIVALSALGNPLSFEASVARLGYEVRPFRLPDHHDYSEADWNAIRAAASSVEAEHIITTEKDATKLPSPVPADLAVHVLGCELAIREGHDSVDHIIEATSACASTRNTPSGAPLSAC